MRLRKIVAATVAASMGFSSLAFAQGFGGADRGRHDNAPAAVQSGRPAGDARQQQAPQRQYQRQQAAQGYSQQYAQQHRTYQPQAQYYGNYAYRSAPSYYAPRTVYVQTAPRYYSGYRLPYNWRRNMYVVNDWRAYNLYAPPYGYTWVQSTTGEYLLVALATGIIASLLLR